MTQVSRWLQAFAAHRVRAGVAVACLGGFVLPWALGAVFPPAGKLTPFNEIAASFGLNLAGLALMLAWLPNSVVGGRWSVVGNSGAAVKCASTDHRSPTTGHHFRSWLDAAAVIGALHFGAWLSPGQQESFRTYFTLAALCAAQAASLSALHALLALPFGRRPQLQRQLCFFVLGLAVTALFWSRAPIQAEHQDRLADAVMHYSPPFAVAAVWYQESDAARHGAEAARFDLVRGPLTYDVWIGSYQAVAYPQIWPRNEDGFQFGLVLGTLLASLAVILALDAIHL